MRPTKCKAAIFWAAKEPPVVEDVEVDPPKANEESKCYTRDLPHVELVGQGATDVQPVRALEVSRETRNERGSGVSQLREEQERDMHLEDQVSRGCTGLTGNAARQRPDTEVAKGSGIQKVRNQSRTKIMLQDDAWRGGKGKWVAENGI
ncbi:uncharacterized protein EI90DRAFT_3013173 [Cantharellus anzutake]|uniref:uncharacterized protein n=1 Tax=Cantharellus anzutake TaxID=1750568 RepID=UPI0019030CA4|nr:uncharacterized protein EI90DRAFT_3013173 [Cantharellus anzutake]KAF8339119.1 hypothetical protein EI90DRAFT_3013173 [Cantharellus anzutake]